MTGLEHFYAIIQYGLWLALGIGVGIAFAASLWFSVRRLGAADFSAARWFGAFILRTVLVTASAWYALQFAALPAFLMACLGFILGRSCTTQRIRHALHSEE